MIDELGDAHADMRSVGEPVTFRGNSITVAPINRMPGKQDLDRLNWDEATDSIVELPGDLAEPTAGECVKDKSNRYHRIQKCAFNGIAWVCACRVSAEP